MTMGYSSTGQKGGSGDAKALFFSLFAGEVMRLWPQAFVLNGKITTGTISENKEVKDRIAGMVNAQDFTRGTILSNSTDSASNAPNAQKFNELITRLDDPIESHDIVYNFDYLMSPSGDQDRSAMIAEMIQAIAFRADLRGISTLIQTAAIGVSSTGLSLYPSTHPYVTKTLAATRAGMSGTGFGYNTNSSLTSTASGSTIEDELFKHRDYLNYIGVPQEDVYSLVSPTYAMKLWKEQGQRVSIGYTTSGATVTHPATQSLSMAPRGPQTLYHMGTGITVVPCRHLPNLGTTIDTAFSPSDTLGSKYAPGSTQTDTISGINGIAPVTSGCFEMGLTTSNPQDWNSNTKNTQEVYDSVRIITFHKRAIRQAVLEGLKSGAEKRLDLLNGELIAAWLTCGFGAKDPTAVCYSIEALP